MGISKSSVSSLSPPVPPWQHEEVHGELLSVQRDLQVAYEEAQAGADTRECLIQELHAKQAQVCALEGQLDSSRAHAHTLEQEVKRSAPLQCMDVCLGS